MLTAISNLAIKLVQGMQNALLKVRYDLSADLGINLLVETSAEKLFDPQRKEMLDEIERVRDTFISLLTKYDNLTYRSNSLIRLSFNNLSLKR